VSKPPLPHVSLHGCVWSHVRWNEPGMDDTESQMEWESSVLRSDSGLSHAVSLGKADLGCPNAVYS
jgi:hypothetical protein